MIEKSAMITIAGRPNVGKSTLLNALVGEKIAIVSNKPQTTRNRISAILNRGDTQFVFLDTPGFHKPRTKLGDYMVGVVNESVSDVDAVILIVEPIAGAGKQEEALIAQLHKQNAPALLVINKIDTVERTRCWRSSPPTRTFTPSMHASPSAPSGATGCRSCCRSWTATPSPARSSSRTI